MTAAMHAPSVGPILPLGHNDETAARDDPTVDPRTTTTMGGVLAEHARSRPGHPAAVDGDRRYSYAELDGRVNQLGHALAVAGVGAGDRILWLGQNSFRVLETLLAAGRLGAMLCPANWRQSTDELAFVLDDLDARVVIWQEAEIGDTVREARARARAPEGLWLQHDADGPDCYEAFLASGSSEPPALDVDPASANLVIYTAAFEGRPNGAMLSHTALVTGGLMLARMMEVGPEAVFLNSGPLFHIGTFMSTLATFVHGGTNVFTPRVDPEELCRLIDTEKCTGAFIVGPTVRQIMAVNRDGRYDLKSLRAAPGKREWNEMVTVDTSAWMRYPGGYGQTEVMGMLTFNALAPDGTGTHGRPSPLVQVRIVDPDDRDLPVGEVGEIVVRGATVMNGYWNRPEVNAARARNGWHHTNDLGRREPDGTISFIAPLTRMIKSAAENIYPAEVEATIKSHPGVQDCAVIGVPDKKWVQSVKAIVVRADGQPVDEAELIEHCRTRMASYKKPRFVEFAAELPRSGFAVDYDALDEKYGGGNYPGGRTRSA
jgi:acyl-CoA synthetase (AMP-forming)/AMP-acid ligase II